MAGGRPELLAFIDRSNRRRQVRGPEPRPTGSPGALQDVGRATSRVRESALDLLGFVGVITAGVGRISGA